MGGSVQGVSWSIATQLSPTADSDKMSNGDMVFWRRVLLRLVAENSRRVSDVPDSELAA